MFKMKKDNVDNIEQHDIDAEIIEPRERVFDLRQGIILKGCRTHSTVYPITYMCGINGAIFIKIC